MNLRPLKEPFIATLWRMVSPPGLHPSSDSLKDAVIFQLWLSQYFGNPSESHKALRHHGWAIAAQHAVKDDKLARS